MNPPLFSLGNGNGGSFLLHVCYSLRASRCECTARDGPGAGETTRTTTYITDPKYFVSSSSVACMISGD